MKKAIKKLRKSIVLPILSISLAAGSLPYAVYANDSITVTLDNVPIELDVSPVIREGRTLVPMRAIFEAFNLKVEWFGANNLIIARGDNNLTIAMTVGDCNFNINGEPKIADVAPAIIDGRTLVPVRVISESLGCEVSWNESTKTVAIYSDDTVAESSDAIPLMATSSQNSEKITSSAPEVNEVSAKGLFTYNGQAVHVDPSNYFIEGGSYYLNLDGLKQAFPNYDANITYEESKGTMITAGDKAVKYSTNDSFTYVLSQSGEIVKNKFSFKNKNNRFYFNMNELLPALGCGSFSNGSFVYSTPSLTAEQEAAKQAAQEANDKLIAEDNVKQQAAKDLEQRITDASLRAGSTGYNFTSLERIPMGDSYQESLCPADVGYVCSISMDQGTMGYRSSIKTAPLSAGSKFGVFKGGILNVYQIPSNAVAIHSSGDMRYGWVDYRNDGPIKEYLEVLRQVSDEKGDRTFLAEDKKSEPLTVSRLASDNGATVREKQFRSVYDAGINPTCFILQYTGDIRTHQGGGIAEVMAYTALDPTVGQGVHTSQAVSTMLDGLRHSPGHWKTMVNPYYSKVDPYVIVRPDLSFKLVINFGD